MRGETIRYAELENEGYITIDRDGWKVYLTLRKRPREEVVMLSVHRGVFTCDGHFKTAISVKFDDGPIETFKCVRAGDGSAIVIFLQPEAKFIQKLRKAKKLMVETEFYAEGPRQITFRPAGLSW